MKLHFVNSGFVSVPGALVLEGAGFARLDLRVRYGIVQHPGAGLIVLDGGYAPSVYTEENPSLLLRAYRGILRPVICDAGQPRVALSRIGATPEDVRHVVVTHFHLDHVGYLDRFPNATLHVSQAALDELGFLSKGTLARRGIFRESLSSRFGDRAQAIEEAPTAQLPDALGRSGYDILGDGSLISVPLPGHATGHFGLLFPTLDKTPLYATDVAWTMAGLLQGRERKLAIRAVADNFAEAQASAARVRAFRADCGADILLCHDPDETSYDLTAEVS